MGFYETGDNIKEVTQKARRRIKAHNKTRSGSRGKRTLISIKKTRNKGLYYAETRSWRK